MARHTRVLATLGTVLALGLAAGAEPEFAIPYDRLAPTQAGLVRDVLDHASLSTEFAREEVQSSVTTYDALLDRLPLTARMTRALGLGRYVIKDVEEEGCVVLDDREGVKVSLYEVYHGAGLRVYYTKGYYQGPLLPKVRGRGVIALRYEADGQAIATSAKLWFRIDSGVARAMTHLLYPLVLDIVKDKGAVFIVAAREIATRMAGDPEGVYRRLKESGRFTEEELADCRTRVLADSTANADRR